MVLRRLYDFIWDERWWFPTNYSGEHYGWIDLKNTPGSGIYIPEIAHLHWAFLVGVCQVVLRFLLIRLVWRPIGIKVGILNNGARDTRCYPNGLSEGTCAEHKYDMENTDLSKKTDRTEAFSNEWSHKNKLLRERKPKYYRLCWDLMYTTTMGTYGLFIAWNNNWLQQIENIWIGWPKQHVSDAVFLFYIIKGGFYWHDTILFAQDFGHWPVAMRIQLALHHASTLALIYISWMMNVVRFGVIVGILHDITDPSLRTAKICVYAERKALANCLLVIHFFAWILFRIVVFSVFVFYHIMTDVSRLMDEPPVIYYIVVALLVLIVLSNLSYTIGLYHLVEHKTHMFRGLLTKINGDYDEKVTSKMA